jgi:hypothetical protein
MGIIRKLCLYQKNPSMTKFANTQPPEEYTGQHINPWLDALYNGDKPPHSEPSNFALKDMGCLAIYS